MNRLDRFLRSGGASVLPPAGPPAVPLVSAAGLNGAFTFTRASAGALWRSTDNVLVEVGSDVPRLDPALGLLIESTRTNGLRNPRCEGGANGIPGTPPTNWSGFGPFAAGVDVERRGSGVDAGIPYVRYRFLGTSTSSSPAWWNLEVGGSGLPAGSGSVVTHSQFIRTVAGSPGALSYQLEVRDYNAGASLTTAGGPISIGASWRRGSFTRTLSDPLATNAIPAIRVALGVGQSIDWTFDIGAPQIELGELATSPMLPATIAAATRLSDAVSGPVASLGLPASGCTLVCAALSPQGPGGANVLAMFDDGTTANRYFILRNTASNDIIITRTAAGVGASSAVLGTITPGVPYCVAASLNVAAGTMTASFNGGAPLTITGGPVAGISTLRLGNNLAGTANFNGFLRVNARSVPSTGAQLQALSTS